MAPGSAEEQKNRALKETPGQRDQGKRGDPHTGNGAVEARQQGEVDAPKIQDGQDEVFRDKAVLFHHPFTRVSRLAPARPSEAEPRREEAGIGGSAARSMFLQGPALSPARSSCATTIRGVQAAARHSRA